ncbi:spore germination protein [Paenibacillus sp. P36]|uniref:spore germination protein n=1 Tax=Paenibacillus sp. P36 TaxID=3342538 RepID=UPI0038B40525
MNTSNFFSNVTALLTSSLHHSSDLQFRYVEFHGIKLCIAYLETLCNPTNLDKLLQFLQESEPFEMSDRLDTMSQNYTENVSDTIKGLLSGNFAFFLESNPITYLFNGKVSHSRSIEEPSSEKLLQGNHLGFIEDLDTNIYLIRKSLPLPEITVKYYHVGAANTKVAVIYKAGNQTESTLLELEKRLQLIPDNAPITVGLLEEWIEDKIWNLFPQILKTEKPDRVISQLHNNGLAIMFEQSSTALIIPATFIEMFHTTDDYTIRWMPASIYRLLRYFAFIIALIAPGFYISVVSYHFEIIPSDLILKVKTAVEGIPYPPFIEVMIMSITIEIIVEAGLRMPTGIGQIIGIVGGLVIGDAVVKAGFISNIMIITIGITTLSSYIIPYNEMNIAVRLLRIAFSIAASILGFYGMMLLFLFMIIHLCRSTSFNRPFFSLDELLQVDKILNSIIRVHAKIANKLGDKL